MITSPLRPRTQRQESGIAAVRRLAHPRNALRRFTFVRHHDAPMASFRPALTEVPQRNQPHWDRPVHSGPRPCLFGIGFPLSGLQDRIHTSDLNVRTRHTHSPYGLGLRDDSRGMPSVRAIRQHQQHQQLTPGWGHFKPSRRGQCKPSFSHCRYYAVPGNFKAVDAFREEAVKHWYRALRRRSQRTSLTWKRMGRLEARWIPPAKIMHPWPNARFDARTQGRSPVR